MTSGKSIIFGAVALLAISLAAYAIPQVRDGYWDSDTPQLTSKDESIVCSRASYRDYRAVSSLAGDLNLDFSPIPEAIADKQRIIDALAAAGPAGNATQVFASYIPTGEVFRTQCAGNTCTRAEIEEPMKACLTQYWNDCVHSLLRYDGQNYCLLEVTEGDE